MPTNLALLSIKRIIVPMARSSPFIALGHKATCIRSKRSNSCQRNSSGAWGRLRVMIRSSARCAPDGVAYPTSSAIRWKVKPALRSSRTFSSFASNSAAFSSGVGTATSVRFCFASCTFCSISRQKFCRLTCNSFIASNDYIAVLGVNFHHPGTPSCLFRSNQR